LTNHKKENKNNLFKFEAYEPVKHLCNDLELVTVDLCPEVSTAKAMLLDLGADGALMSGSGPTVFGIYSDSEHAANAQNVILRARDQWRVFVAEAIV